MDKDLLKAVYDKVKADEDQRLLVIVNGLSDYQVVSLDSVWLTPPGSFSEGAREIEARRAILDGRSQFDVEALKSAKGLFIIDHDKKSKKNKKPSKAATLPLRIGLVYVKFFDVKTNPSACDDFAIESLLLWEA